MFHQILQSRLLSLLNASTSRDFCEAVLLLENPEDIDREIEGHSSQLKSAGLEDVGNSLLRLFSRKLSLSAAAENIPPQSDAESAHAGEVALVHTHGPNITAGEVGVQSRKRPRSDFGKAGVDSKKSALNARFPIGQLTSTAAR